MWQAMCVSPRQRRHRNCLTKRSKWQRWVFFHSIWADVCPVLGSRRCNPMWMSLGSWRLCAAGEMTRIISCRSFNTLRKSGEARWLRLWSKQLQWYWKKFSIIDEENDLKVFVEGRELWCFRWDLKGHICSECKPKKVEPSKKDPALIFISPNICKFSQSPADTWPGTS